MTTRMFKATYPLEGYIPPGSSKWFEYHCTESHTSADAPLWYRSQQLVIVLGLVEDYRYLSGTTPGERWDDGVLLHYHIRFADGFEGEAGEDELLNDPSEFCRPAPPPPPPPAPRRKGRTARGRADVATLVFRGAVYPNVTADALPPPTMGEGWVIANGEWMLQSYGPISPDGSRPPLGRPHRHPG